jgi:MFS family permease
MGKRRWLVAAAGLWLQSALGSVYAWSLFQPPMRQHYGFGAESPVAWVLSSCICFLGLGLAYVTPIATVARWFPDKKMTASKRPRYRW